MAGGRHRRLVTRVLVAGGLVGAAMVLLPQHASAKITGNCTAKGYETSTNVTPAQAKSAGTPDFDITTQDVWHVHADSYVSGMGQATTPQKNANVVVAAFGFGIHTIIDAHGDGGTSGSGGPYKISDWDSFIRIIGVSGGADTCQGSFLIIVDDKNAATTAAGGGGLLLGVLGLAGVAGVALRRIG